MRQAGTACAGMAETPAIQVTPALSASPIMRADRRTLMRGRRTSAGDASEEEKEESLSLEVSALQAFRTFAIEI